MKKFISLVLTISCLAALSAQTLPQPWRPQGIADSTFPRSIIHSSEIDAVKASLAAGTNIDLYQKLYLQAMGPVPAENDYLDVVAKSTRAAMAKNAAFVALLGVRPSGNTTVALSGAESSQLKSKAIGLLEELNPYVSQMTLDSPTNFDHWQWNSKEIIQFTCAYDLLKGAGVSDAELADAKQAIKTYTGNLYIQANKGISGTNFFQGAKNNHALMTAGAIGMAAVILNDLEDTFDYYQPLNWMNAAMWNIHNVIWWDIRHQSIPGVVSGYAEGTYYLRYGFCNLLPFFRAMGYYLKDTTLEYTYNSIPRRLRNPWYDTNYYLIYDWVRMSRFPDGRMAPIEDSYLDAAFPELAILRQQRYVWPLYLSSLDTLQHNTLDKMLTMVYDMRADYIASNMVPQETPDSLFTVMPEAGIAVFRSGQDSSATYFALCGKHGDALEAAEAHNHADDASFMMVVNGQMMAMDPGYGNFLLRDSVSRATAHNMILVDGAGPSQGFPGKSNGAETFIEKYFSSPVQDYAEARTSYLEANINRKVFHVRKKYFLLIDHVSAPTPKQFSWLLHGYGSEGGFEMLSGRFTDMLDHKRAAWKRRNSGLYTYTDSDVPFTFEKGTGVHEYTFGILQEHAYISANSQPTTGISYISCLQPYRNLSDTFAVQTIHLSSAIAYKIVDGSSTDIAVTKSFDQTLDISSSSTGLSDNYSTDAHLLWVSESSGTVADLFMYKGRVLKRNADTLVSCDYPVNVDYRKTGAKTYEGYCGDTGWVRFHTGEYTYMLGGPGVSGYDYDLQRKVVSVYFRKASTFNIVLDDTKIGIGEIVPGKELLSVYPNPASDMIYFEMKEMLPEHCRIELTDITGRLVKSWTLKGAYKTAAVPVEDLGNGLYFGRVTDSKGNASGSAKILISK